MRQSHLQVSPDRSASAIAEGLDSTGRVCRLPRCGGAFAETCPSRPIRAPLRLTRLVALRAGARPRVDYGGKSIAEQSTEEHMDDPVSSTHVSRRRALPPQERRHSWRWVRRAQRPPSFRKRPRNIRIRPRTANNATAATSSSHPTLARASMERFRPKDGARSGSKRRDELLARFLK